MLVYVLHKREIRHFHALVVQKRERNVKKVWCTCEVVVLLIKLACSKRSDSGERCGVKKAMESRGGLGRAPLLLPRFYFFALLFTSHRSRLSERMEQAIIKPIVFLTFSLPSASLDLKVPFAR